MFTLKTELPEGYVIHEGPKVNGDGKQHMVIEYDGSKPLGGKGGVLDELLQATGAKKATRQTNEKENFVHLTL